MNPRKSGYYIVESENSITGTGLCFAYYDADSKKWNDSKVMYWYDTDQIKQLLARKAVK
jgi:hypothetical protein